MRAMKLSPAAATTLTIRRDLPGQICGHKLAHAEINALLAVSLPHDEFRQLAIYTTMEPCPLCMGAIYMAGVRRIYYACRDSYAGSIDMLGSTPYLSRKPIKAFGPPRGDLENILAAIQTEDILVRYPGPTQPRHGRMAQGLPGRRGARRAPGCRTGFIRTAKCWPPG